MGQTEMIPDAIIVLSGGSVAEKDSQTGETIYRSTTYAEADAFGTLGGLARIQAAALFARRFPLALVVTTSRRGDEGPTHARIAADELVALGVPRERILLEESSVDTRTQIEESLRIARERGWKHALFVTNKYQMERVRAFVEHLHQRPDCEILYQDAESVLSESDPSFSAEFARIEQSEPYQHRLAAEARGVAAIRSGTYHSSSSGDKQERSV